MGKKIITATLATLGGLGVWQNRIDANKELENKAAIELAQKDALRERAESNQSVLDPIYSTEKYIVTDEKDTQTGLTRPKLDKDPTNKIASEVTVTAKDDENDNKVFVLANSSDQAIRPKGGYNKVMLMPPLNFGHKTIDNTGAVPDSYNELNIDSRILAHYDGTMVMRDGDDLIVKFMKANEAPKGTTPTIIVKGQFTKGTKAVLNEFGVIKMDGTVEKVPMLDPKQSRHWETVIIDSIKKYRAAFAANDVPSLPTHAEVNTRTLDEIIEDGMKRAAELQRQILEAKQAREVTNEKALTPAERELQVHYNRMKTDIMDRIGADDELARTAVANAVHRMAEDLKKTTNAEQHDKPSPTARR